MLWAGEFEAGFDRSGQTREHAMLAKTAGVKFLVVLVNKMDDASVGWDVERYACYSALCGLRDTYVVFMTGSVGK
jgi:translation elongation factor EF-1alpha